MTNMMQFQTKGHKYEYKWIKPGSLKIDPLYQRELNHNRVAKIVSSWDYDLVNEPKVAMRADGSYYVFDGQHTIAAWRIHEGEDVPILCKVFSAMNWETEKTLFVQQNGISADPTTAQKLRAEFNANNPTVRGMYNACANVGIKVRFANSGGGGKNSCTAVSALYGAYRSLSEKDFSRVMSVIVRAWDGDGLSLSAGFIKGLKKLFMQYSDKIKDNELAKSLAKLAPEYYVREARELGGNLETKFSTVFLRVYNKNRTTGRLA